MARIVRASLPCALAVALGAAGPTGKSWRECPGYDQVDASHSDDFASCIAASGVPPTRTVRFRLKEPQSELSRSLPSNFDLSSGVAVTDDPLDLTWDTRGRSFNFGSVGGAGEAVLVATVDLTEHSVQGMEFAWQNRPLRLSEALARAQSLQAWLAEAGYRTADMRDGPWEAPFGIIVNDFQPPTDWAAGWPSLESRLGSDERVAQMHLFTMTSDDTRVDVSLQDRRRMALQFQEGVAIARPAHLRRTVYDGDGGYEWFVQVRISAQQLEVR